MEKYFVTHSQAVALKELGFDEPCLAVYAEGSKQLIINNTIRNWNDQLKNGNTTSAPLKSQVFEWFREKHELVANWLYDQHDNYGSYIGVSIKNVHFEETIVGVYKIHEEAESACIDKLIEIVKKCKVN